MKEIMRLFLKYINIIKKLLTLGVLFVLYINKFSVICNQSSKIKTISERFGEINIINSKIKQLC